MTETACRSTLGPREREEVDCTSVTGSAQNRRALIEGETIDLCSVGAPTERCFLFPSRYTKHANESSLHIVSYHGDQ